MFDLKPISARAIPEALSKAERYRLLNEPWEAESICLDILRAEPGHQRALVTLILSLTDQFGHGVSQEQAREYLPQLPEGYEQVYYNGLICERWADALLRRGHPGAGFLAYEWLLKAMEFYEQAEALRPPGNDDSLLRWNTCARLVMRNPELRARDEDELEPAFD